MPPPTSAVWLLFHLKHGCDRIAVCDICGLEIARGSETAQRKSWTTSSILTHLKTLHRKDWAEAQKFAASRAPPPPTLAEEAAHPTPGRLKSLAQTRSLRDHFSPQRPWKSDDGRQRETNRKLLQMVVRNNQPFSIVEDEGFINYTAHLQPLYTLPCRKTLTELLEPEYNNVRQVIQDEINAAKFVSFTSDVWTEDTTKASFLSLSGKILF